MSNGIAQEIARQIGPKAIAMMGAKDLVNCGDGLRFKLGGGAKGPNGRVTHIKVELDPSDTYTVRFYRVRKLEVKEVATESGVYVDQLHGVIEAGTGFYLSL